MTFFRRGRHRHFRCIYPAFPLESEIVAAHLRDLDGDGLPTEEDPDIDGDDIPNEDDDDIDGDEILNDDDPDIDGDGLDNDDDPDDDGDGISDEDEIPPYASLNSMFLEDAGARVTYGNTTTIYNGITKCTWNFWIQDTVFTDGAPIWKKVNNGGAQFHWIFITTGTGGFSVNLGAAILDTSGTWVSAPGVISIGWHQVTVVFDGTQSTDSTRLRVYVDGVDITDDGAFAFQPIPAALRASSTSLVTIGGDWPVSIDGLYLDDLSVWPSVAATPSQVLELRTEADTPADPFDTTLGTPATCIQCEGDATDAGSAPELPTTTGTVSYPTEVAP